MLRAHSADAIRSQEIRFAKAGQTWDGMIYDKDGEVRPGAKVPTWHGQVVGLPQKAGDTGVAGGTGTGTGTGVVTVGGGGNTGGLGGNVGIGGDGGRGVGLNMNGSGSEGDARGSV